MLWLWGCRKVWTRERNQTKRKIFRIVVEKYLLEMNTMEWTNNRGEKEREGLWVKEKTWVSVKHFSIFSFTFLFSLILLAVVVVVRVVVIVVVCFCYRQTKRNSPLHNRQLYCVSHFREKIDGGAKKGRKKERGRGRRGRHSISIAHKIRKT